MLDGGNLEGLRVQWIQSMSMIRLEDEQTQGKVSYPVLQWKCIPKRTQDRGPQE